MRFMYVSWSVGDSWEGFFLVYFMLFEQNEKLKPGGSVEAVVIPLTELWELKKSNWNLSMRHISKT